MTRGSVFYFEIWPPGQYSAGVTFLRDIVELIVWFGFLQEKNDPPLAVEYWPGVTFLRRKMTPGQYSKGVTSLRYNGTLCRTGTFCRKSDHLGTYCRTSILCRTWPLKSTMAILHLLQTTNVHTMKICLSYSIYLVVYQPRYSCFGTAETAAWSKGGITPRARLPPVSPCY
jgi:hypothetical protein